MRKYPPLNTGLDSVKLTSSMKIRPISKPGMLTKYNSFEYEILKRKRNYQEFSNIYRNVFMEQEVGKQYARPVDINAAYNRSTNPNLQKQLYKNIKTVKVELPTFGSEQAIAFKKKVGTNSVPSIKKEKRKQRKVTFNTNVQVKSEISDEISTTHKLLEKLKQMEADMEEDNENVNIIDKANQEIEIASSQLKHIKHLINAKKCTLETLQEEVESPPKRKNLPKLPVWNLKKIDRDGGKKKKVMTALSTLNKRLQTLHEKYSEKPRPAYKSVDNKFVQVDSGVTEIIYQNNSFPENPTETSLQSCSSRKLRSTLELIKAELDHIANLNTNDDTKPEMINEATNTRPQPYTVKSSTTTVKKFTDFDVVHTIETIYNEINDMDPLPQERGEIVDITPPNPILEAANIKLFCDKSVFENTEVQKMVGESEYLKKEFNISTNVKYFKDNNKFGKYDSSGIEATDQDSYVRYPTKRFRARFPKMYEKLKLALSNSLYKPSDESNVM